MRRAQAHGGSSPSASADRKTNGENGLRRSPRFLGLCRIGARKPRLCRNYAVTAESRAAAAIGTTFRGSPFPAAWSFASFSTPSASDAASAMA
jgi:hypothetical protein